MSNYLLVMQNRRMHLCHRHAHLLINKLTNCCQKRIEFFIKVSELKKGIWF